MVEIITLAYILIGLCVGVYFGSPHMPGRSQYTIFLVFGVLWFPLALGWLVTAVLDQIHKLRVTP